MLDLRAELGEYLDLVVGRVDAEDVLDRQVGVPLVRLVEARSRHLRVRVRVHGLAAAFAIVFLVGGFAWLGSDRVEIADNPTPTTGLEPSPAAFSWTMVENRSGLPPIGAFMDIVSNGSKLAASDIFSSQAEFGGGVRLWTSVNGTSWSPERARLSPERARLNVHYGAEGEFLAFGIGPGTASPTVLMDLWRSSDGVTWTRVDPAPGVTPHELWSFHFFGLTIDEILGLSLPLSLPDAWDGGGARGAIFKIDGNYVSYYWPADAEPDSEGAESNVASSFSPDGRAWRTFQPPGFLVDWFHSGSPRAMGDRGYSDRLWSGTFAVDGSRVLALTGDDERHTLWESTDGLSWQEIQPDTRNAPGSHVFNQGVGLGYYENGTTYGVFRMSEGWVILPWASAEPGLWFSVDGRNWQFIEPPEDLLGVAWCNACFSPGLTRAAGDKVLFVLYGDTETVRDFMVATYEATYAQP